MEMLKEKAGIITGGGTGIGREAAILFAKNGAKLVICGRREEKLLETVELVRAIGGEIYHVCCDVSKEDEVEGMVKFSVEKMGKLDFAFNNAGITSPAPGKLIHEIPTGAVEQIMAINGLGVFYSMKYELPYLLENGGGTIVNNCSINSTCVTKAGAPYSASKYAAYAYTMCAALDYADKNIRVNGIGPGVTMTPMIEATMKAAPEKIQGLINAIPDGRTGTALDQAQAAMFLLSDLSSHINGQLLLVDGGQSVKM